MSLVTRNRILVLTISGSLLIGLVIALSASNSPDPGSERAVPLAIAERPDSMGVIEPQSPPSRVVVDGVDRQQPGEVPADGASVELTAPDEVSKTVFSKAVAAKVVPVDFTLPSVAAWTRFVDVWGRASEPVSSARGKLHDLGRSLAKERFKAGQYVETPFDESQRVDGGFPTDDLTRLRHPDEWVSLKMLGREGGGTTFQVVRIMPGEVLALDDATMELRLAEGLRRDAIHQLMPDLRNMR